MKYRKEDLVNRVIEMRLKEMKSAKSIIEYLMTEEGYGQSYAYEILKDARVQIKDYYDDKNKASLEEAIGQLEQLAEDMRAAGENKMAFNVRQELSKIQGHYKERIELTGELSLKNIEIVVKTNQKPDEPTE